MTDLPGNFDRYFVRNFDRDLCALLHWHRYLMTLVPRNLFTVLIRHLDRNPMARLLWHIMAFLHWLLDWNLNTVLLRNLVTLLVVSIAVTLLPVISVTLLFVTALIGDGTNGFIASGTLILVFCSCGWVACVLPVGDTLLLVVIVGGTFWLVYLLVLDLVLGVVDRLAFWLIPMHMSMLVPVVVAMGRGGKQGNNHKLKRGD